MSSSPAPAGGDDCGVTVEVGADGTVSATSTGGMVTAMNSDAYNTRITPMAVDLAPVTTGFMAGAGTVQVAAGQSVVRGDVEFGCAAGGADCQVMVMVDANGGITATSTGGMVTAMNSDAYTDRIATMHPVVGKWAGDWPGGARTVLTITSVSADGQVTGTYRHQERGGQPFILEISPDGPVTASIENGVLSFSFGQSTFEFTETAEDTLSFAFQFSPDAQMVSVDVDRQDADGTMPTAVPSQEALANVIDLVANDSRQDSSRNYISGWWWRSHGIGAQQAAITGTYRGGQWANAIVSHDDNGQLQHNVAVLQINPLQQADPQVQIGRYINTYNAPEELEGVTNSTRSISDHGLGWEWQVTELSADYDNDGGSLSIYVATDIQPSDGSQDPFELAAEIDYNIELPGVPALPADQDVQFVGIGDGDTIEGSLDDVPGTFSCANAEGCTFVDDHRPGDYYASSPGVTFTPDGGTAEPVTPSWSGTVPNADYLAIGHWLYVPEDVTDSVNYEFGVFASGGDPFEASYLAALTGTATYLGDALGMYYVDGLSSSPTVGSFTADAILTADFGDDSETGFISGEVNNFVFEDDVASSLPATVNLTSDPYSYLSANFGVAEDSTNIFDTNWSGDAAPYPGGHIAAEATASADGHNWYGEWHAAFYGNGLATTDIPPSYVEHPTSVAGTFNVSTYDDNKRVDSGLAGSFGAHRYDDGLTRGDPSNLANAIDLIADNGRQDDQGNYISAWTWANWGVGAQQAAANHTYREGSHANVIVFHDENEELQFNVAIVKNDTAPLLQETPVWVQAHQYLETEEIGQTLEGVTRFMRPVMDHDLGSGWQVAELTNDYDNGGTLTINIATDLEVAGMSENPFAGPSQYGRSIILDDVPDIPAGKDFVVAWINNGESITGTLDGVAGAFSCANPEGCSFFDDVQEGDFYPASEDVTFVPDDGSADVPLPISFGVPVDTANYLAFGNWLYVPEDVTDMDAYDFGVFASGGDPFRVQPISSSRRTCSLTRVTRPACTTRTNRRPVPISGRSAPMSS